LADDLAATSKQVKEASDIVEVVGGYVALRQQGQVYKGLCPFHDDHRPSFDVDPRRQRYRCWSCGKNGDVFTFIMEQERVGFREALELLARRAGITLEKLGRPTQNPDRARMIEAMQWAAELYHAHLLDAPTAEAARIYLGERKLTGETVRRFGLGFAPPGNWLVRQAAGRGLSFEVLEKVGLVARQLNGEGFYDRFRDRVLFPIRNMRGQVVGFGGRILPSSPKAEGGPKYYNSPDSLIFSKRRLLYGLDQARQAAATSGHIAVVEGYTDVLMAQQMGIPQVVSTMGTALGALHVQELRRWMPNGRVILVFDADAGGHTGVDRALEIFVSQEVDLAVATLPEGMDPCDLLVQEGPEPFRRALTEAVDALDFKLNRVLTAEAANTVEGRRRAVDAVLGIIALAPDMPGQAGAVKQELVVTRIASRLGIKEETVWGRLRELRAQRRGTGRQAGASEESEKRSAPASPREQQLLQLLLAEPALVAKAVSVVAPTEVEHPGLRRLLEGLYVLHREGEPPTLDQLRTRIPHPALMEAALKLQDVGRAMPDRARSLQQLLAEFRKRREEPKRQEIQNQLHAACDHTEAVALLKRLQQHSVDVHPGTADGTGTGP